MNLDSGMWANVMQAERCFVVDLACLHFHYLQWKPILAPWSQEEDDSHVKHSLCRQVTPDRPNLEQRLQPTLNDMAKPSQEGPNSNLTIYKL